MIIFLALVAISLAASINGAPSSRYVIHQRRNPSNTAQWVQENVTLDKSSTIPVSIGLAQQNLDKGEEYLMDVSDPTSANYGKLWTPAQLTQKFGATNATITAVKLWLAASGIAGNRSTLSNGRNWINVQLTISEAEKLLKTEYMVVQNTDTNRKSLACEDYSVPQDLQEHIDLITPTVKSIPMKRVSHNNKKASTIAVRERQAELLLKRDWGIDPWSWDISNCTGMQDYPGLTRACAQALYHIPNGTLTASSYGIYELQNEAYNQSDLDAYMNQLVSRTLYNDPVAIYVMPDTVFLGNGSQGADFAEGNLDVQIAAGLTYPQSLTYYQVGSDDLFMDAVDASYCPTTSSNETNECGSTPLTSVISVSWGGDESSDPSDIIVEQRQCNEYLKLGLLGTTILYSSGDNGVAGTGDDCTTFLAQFPASCPWVTAVGATKISGSLQSTEVAVEYFASGGGFSNVFPIPSYQSNAVNSYLQNHKPNIDPSLYNSTGQARGYPDISANGNGYALVQNGSWTAVGGTSQSAPLFGSIISLINEERVAAGKKTVGFINPMLYANAQALNDVVKGSNPGCGTSGFNATEGWDPVTGLGTANYDKLLNVFMASQ